MTKTIFIIILGLLWFSVALADFPLSNKQNQWVNSGKIFPGMNWKQFSKLGGLGGADYGPVMYSTRGNYIVTVQDRNIYIFKKKPNEKAYKVGFTSKKPILINIYNNEDIFKNWSDAKKFIIEKEGSATFYKGGGLNIESALAYLNAGPPKKTKTASSSSTSSSQSSSSSSTSSSQSSSSSSSSTDDKIAQAKQICKDLGFKTKTEKFADCSLKMLSMQFEVQNRESSSDGGTQQNIVVNQGYSVGDAMIALSGIISDANNVRSSYGGGNCRIFQHAYHASLRCN